MAGLALLNSHIIITLHALTYSIIRLTVFVTITGATVTITVTEATTVVAQRALPIPVIIALIAYTLSINQLSIVWLVTAGTVWDWELASEACRITKGTSSLPMIKIAQIAGARIVDKGAKIIGATRSTVIWIRRLALNTTIKAVITKLSIGIGEVVVRAYIITFLHTMQIVWLRIITASYPMVEDQSIHLFICGRPITYIINGV